MNILISVDDKFLEIAKVMLFSIKSNVQEKINVYVLYQEASKAFESFAKSMNGLGGVEVYKLDVPEDFVQGYKVTLHYSIAMYFRIFAHLLLPESIDRILYLDADIIVNKDITSFYAQDFEDKYMIVNKDKNADGEDVSKHKEELGISQKHKYFNSGVLLMNLKKMREDITQEYLTSTIEDLQDVLWYPDQDVLNKVYENKVKYDDYNKYNAQYFYGNHPSRLQLKNAQIIHFVGGIKPWCYKGIISSFSKYFWIYKCKMNKLYVVEYAYTYLLAIAYKICRKAKRIVKNCFGT